MNNNPLLSIIVPVYNVEQYLKKCIDSILSQTLTDFELILVDDGSTDNSGKICDEYTVKDERIIVIHKENKGASSSRNKGLEIAKGEFVTFMDSDDELYPGTLKENIDILLTNRNIDILQFPYFNIDKNGNIIKHSTSTPIIYSDKKEIIKDIIGNEVINYAIWSKIFRKDIYKKIHFNEKMIIGEDICAFMNIIDYINCLYISNIGGYFYYFREGSVFNSNYSLLKILDYARMQILKYKKCLQYNVDGSKLWNSAVILCIDSYAYYGPSNEFIDYLKFLYNNKNNISNKHESEVVIKLSKIFSPLVIARIKRIKYLIFKMFNIKR